MQKSELLLVVFSRFDRKRNKLLIWIRETSLKIILTLREKTAYMLPLGSVFWRTGEHPESTEGSLQWNLGGELHCILGVSISISSESSI